MLMAECVCLLYFPSLSLFRRDKTHGRGPQRVPTKDPDRLHPVAADTALAHRIPSYLFANVHADLSRSDRRRSMTAVRSRLVPFFCFYLKW